MRPSKARGAALITVLIMMGILAVVVTGLMVYVNQQRVRNAIAARQTTRLSCAEAGLRMARRYFAANMTNWNTYLAAPATYNPVQTYDPGSSAYLAVADPNAIAALCNPWTAGPPPAPASTCPNANIVADLDGDGQTDVYMYIRDNEDEFLPSANKPKQDSDQVVIVGAVCVSTTLVPRRNDGTTDPDQITVEGPLVYNMNLTAYSAQAGGGSLQTNNLNQ